MRYRFLRFPGGKFKAVTLSYDDDCRADMRFVKVIDKYGLKCTFNINTAFYKEDESVRWTMSQEEIASLKDTYGHELAVHGHEHLAPGVVTPSRAIFDVQTCRLEMEKDFGGFVRGMAYPDSGINRLVNGVTYPQVREYLKDLGIVYARALGGDNDKFDLPTDWHAWMPTAHHNNPNLMGWIERFVNLKEENTRSSQRAPRMFYLWGHAYEFDNNDNWDRLEEIGEKLGGHEDTWYATNIEICDYVHAFEQIVESADGKRIYNPTLYTLWYDLDGVAGKIEPGETVTLEE